jgi:hypothetical protein
VESLDSFVPGLTRAFCEPGDSEPIKFGKFIVPKTFKAVYMFTEPSSDLRQSPKAGEWTVIMSVSVSDLGTPVLDSIEISGNVTRSKLKIVEQYRYLLLELALKIVIKTRTPTYRDLSQKLFTQLHTEELLAGKREFTYTAENMKDYLDVSDSESTPEFVRWWTSNTEPLTRSELQELNNTINTALKRRITPEYLQHIATVYTQAVIDGKNPVQTIMDSERVRHRTASDYASKARAKGFLPDTDPGVVTIETPKSSITERTRKGKNGK